jgi:hypothetical protein
MPDGSFFLHDFGPELELVRSLHSETESAQRATLRRRLRRRLDKARFDLNRLKQDIEALYIRTGDVTAEPQKFGEAMERGRLSAENFRAEVENLQRKLDAKTPAEEREFFEDALGVAHQWLSVILVARQELPGSVGRDAVRPRKGEIDWAELSREHIARYPKIRARLAE